MEISYICSLGSVCHSAQLLKRNKLKLCSYPFDWIFSDYNNILHSIEDKFKIFLDKTYYINISNNMCGHSYYNKQMFKHHNPLTNENDYNYFIRCINRFNRLLDDTNHKLFIMIFINMNNMNKLNNINNINNLKNNIIEFNNKLSNYTTNYTLLVIFHINKHESQFYNFTINNNIDFLELHTISNSNGLQFANDDDNNFLDTILKSKYKFNLK
jgi:hypothetical protein